MGIPRSTAVLVQILGVISNLQNFNMSSFDEIFQTFDLSGDGTISCGEIEAILKALVAQNVIEMTEEQCEEEAKAVMAKFDKDSSGSLTKDELKAALNCS